MDTFKIAAIVTSYPPLSHASAIVTKFIRGFPTDEGLISPRTKIVSIYIDQIHENDIGHQIAYMHDITVYESIRAAMTLGTENLQVDAVLIIGEHGDYPKNGLGQEMLPRKYFFEQVVGVMNESDRIVPVFSDKHLSYNWQDAAWIYETACDMGIPFWAGSAIPVSWRNPNFEHLLNEPLDDSLVLGFHMLERYGFHAIEGLQCQVERRPGGETGVKSVRCLSGYQVWESAKRGLWSQDLGNHAISALLEGPGNLDPSQIDNPHVFLIEYSDGLRGSVLMLGDSGLISSFAYAGRLDDKVNSFEYTLGSHSNTPVFGYLGLNIEDFFLTSSPPSPLERTYLTTGILEAAMLSNNRSGEIVETPYLDISYVPFEKSVRRPDGVLPSGASKEPLILPEPGKSHGSVSVPISNDGTVRNEQH